MKTYRIAGIAFSLGSLVMGCATPSLYRAGSMLAYCESRVGHSCDVQSVEINMSEGNSALIDDLWIDSHKSERLKLTDVTPAMLRDRRFNEWDCGIGTVRTGEATRGFTLRGLSFYYCGDKLLRFQMDPDSFELGKHETRPRIGLASRIASLTLPCSLAEFESVFGKMDKVQCKWREWKLPK